VQPECAARLGGLARAWSGGVRSWRKVGAAVVVVIIVSATDDGRGRQPDAGQAGPMYGPATG